MHKISRSGFFKYIIDSFISVFACFTNDVFESGLGRFTDSFDLYVRPPGALPAAEFLETCRRCCACIHACPYFAVKLVEDQKSFYYGMPYLAFRQNFCRFCENFPCARACPNGALTLDKTHMKIGMAEIDTTLCLRADNINCRACVTACPERFAAITLDESSKFPHINRRRCVGCGACENACPVFPKSAVVILPHSV